MKLDAEDVNAALIGGIDANLTIVERPRAERVEVLPGLPLVVGAEDAAGRERQLGVGGLALHRDAGLVGLDDGVYDFRVLGIDADAAAAEGAGGQTVGQLVPGLP